jgi:hypothetical protein
MPLSARLRISEKLLADLAVVWEEHGRTFWRNWPWTLATIANGLLPRDMFSSVEQKTQGNLEPEAWVALRRVAGPDPGCRR